MLRLLSTVVMFLVGSCAVLRAQQDSESVGFRVLVRAGEVDVSDLSEIPERAAAAMRGALRARGFRVVEGDPMALAAKTGPRPMSAAAAGSSFEAELLESFVSDLVLELDFEVTAMSKIQGRFVVDDRVRWRLHYSGSAELLSQGEATGHGRSLEDFAAAHEVAILELLDEARDNSLLSNVVRELRGIRGSETELGTRYRLEVWIPSRWRGLTDRVLPILIGAGRIRRGTIEELRRYRSLRFDHGGSGTAIEFCVRLDRDPGALLAGLVDALPESGSGSGSDSESVLRPLLLTFGRRIELCLEVAPPPAQLEDELGRCIRSVIGLIWSRRGHGLERRHLEVLPAHVEGANPVSEFVRFRGALNEAIQAFSIGPGSTEPPGSGFPDDQLEVRFDSKLLTGLEAVGSRWVELESRFSTTAQGRFAQWLGSEVENALVACGEGAVIVGPSSQQRDSGPRAMCLQAVVYGASPIEDPGRLARFESSESDVLVATRLQQESSRYRISVEAIDISQATIYRASVWIDESLSEALGSRLRDH